MTYHPSALDKKNRIIADNPGEIEEEFEDIEAFIDSHPSRGFSSGGEDLIFKRPKDINVSTGKTWYKYGKLTLYYLYDPIQIPDPHVFDIDLSWDKWSELTDSPSKP